MNLVVVLSASALLAHPAAPAFGSVIPFDDSFEEYPLGDIYRSGNPGSDIVSFDEFTGVASGYGVVVNIDDEGIRGNTPEGLYGNQVLKLNNTYSSSQNPVNNIEQAVRSFSEANLPLNYSGGTLMLNFDIRSIATAPEATAVEINIGTARAGRLVFGTDGSNNLGFALLGGEGFQQPNGALVVAAEFGPLVFGDWYNVTLALDVATDSYPFFEIDGTRHEPTTSWDAGVNRFGDNIKGVLLMQGAGDAAKNGAYFDNMTFQSVQDNPEVGEGETYYVATDSFIPGGTVTVNGGAVEFTRTGDIQSNVVIDSDGGELKVTPGMTVTLLGDVQGGSTLVKSSSGTLVLSGANKEFGGTIEVQEGTLAVETGVTGDISVEGSSLLTGTGTVTGNLSVGTGGLLVGELHVTGDTVIGSGGVHSPGFSPSASFSSGNYTLADGSLLIIEMGGLSGGSGTYTNPGTGDYDQLLFGGTVVLETGASIEVRNLDGFLPQVDDTFAILYSATDPIDLGDVSLFGTGALAGYVFSASVLNGQEWNEDGGDYSALFLTVLEIPEPSTTLLILLGLAAWLRRRR